MGRFWIILLSIPLFAGTLPDRYIVELSGESAAQSIAHAFPAGQRQAALLGEPGRQARARVRFEQAAVRSRLESRGARIIGSLDTVANVLFVRMPAVRAARLAGVPGVLRVLPERTYRLTLDHALPLHKVPQAWDLGGAYPQGAGIKIGMIDTGIQITHPGFNDTGFQAPSGFPVADTAADKAFTNQKVIVARSYVGQCLSTDPDTSAQDDVGHGTGTAMAAAGVQNKGPLATITGVAPQAYLGNYKVFGSPGVNDETNSCAIDAAVEDAVNDGMDVLNLSLGGVPAPEIASDGEVAILERAISVGVIVVIAAGNNGPDPNTIGSPGTTPDAITVGAMNNDRIFAASLTVGTSGPYAATPADEALPSAPITAPLVDISAQLDPTGQACAALPANSLNGSMALIMRGTCTFEQKLTFAQQAGAVAALVYNCVGTVGPSVCGTGTVTMEVGTATLPAEMVDNQDGLTIKALADSAGGPVKATMGFTADAAFAIDPNTIALFSSLGPSVDLSIKPDLLAVGENFYTAAESTDPSRRIVQPERLCRLARHQLFDTVADRRRGGAEGGASGLYTSRIQVIAHRQRGSRLSRSGGDAVGTSRGRGLFGSERRHAGHAGRQPRLAQFRRGGGHRLAFRDVAPLQHRLLQRYISDLRVADGQCASARARYRQRATRFRHIFRSGADFPCLRTGGGGVSGLPADSGNQFRDHGPGALLVRRALFHAGAHHGAGRSGHATRRQYIRECSIPHHRCLGNHYR